MADQSQEAMSGYASLLNLEEQPHWTLFLTDFALAPANLRRIARQLETVRTRPLVVRVERGIEYVMQQMHTAGVDVLRDYVSLQGIVSHHGNFGVIDELYSRLPRRDLARIDVPDVACGFRPAYATHLLTIIMRGDYAEQDHIADRFFNVLARRDPYEVIVKTPGAKLQIRDSRPWFALAGRLRSGEMRSLPDGEVAYSGTSDVEGEFVVDGAILPIAQHPRFADESLRLMRLSREVRRQPFRLRLQRGKVVRVSGEGRAPRVITQLLEGNDRYRVLNEVGVSFNRASTRFVHAWPAASSEVRPGVHLGIGGGANPDDQDPLRSSMIHIDCMAANCEVVVNGRPFLRASS